MRTLGSGVLQNPPGSGVIVAVFDTWPANIAARDAAIGGSNPTLTRAANGQLASQVHDYTGTPATIVVPCPHEEDGARLDVSSHGLFVADIIKDIAPNAEVRVYRVLGDDGMGDLQTLAQAVVDAIAAAGQTPLVLNLSLGFGPQLSLLDKLLTDTKLGKGDLKAWQEAIKNALPPANPAAQVKQLVDQQIVQPIVEPAGTRYNFVRGLDIIDHSFARVQAQTNALAIAAAGNDSIGKNKPFGPRVPAALEGVVGVSGYVPPAGAVGGGLTRADYSNNDDLFDNNDGVGAFGGQVVVTNNVSMSDRGLIGLFAGATIPEYLPGHAPASPPAVPPPDNTTGWAMWSGSSFAAPIAAGFAACLWSERTTAPASQIFDWVTRDAGGNRSSLPFRQM